MFGDLQEVKQVVVAEVEPIALLLKTWLSPWPETCLVSFLRGATF